MSFHPSLRFLAVCLAVLFATAIFTPWSEAGLWLAAGCGWTLAGLTLVYVVMGVQGAPPYDDRAFHRTLPPGDGVAFWKVLQMQLLLLAGFAVCVGLYCVIRNFTWLTFGRGLASLLPGFDLMLATGIAATLATSRERSKAWAWLLVFGAPALALLLIGNSAEPMPWSYFLSPRQWERPGFYALAAVAAAFLYLPVWWLIAARRQLRWGAGLAVATGFLMPWLLGFQPPGYGLWARVVKQIPAAARSHVVVVRKAVPEVAADDVLLAKDVFEVRGLAPDEVLELDGTAGTQEGSEPSGWPPQKMFLTGGEMRNPQPRGPGGWAATEIQAGLSDGGEVLWGREGLTATLRRQLTPGMTLKPWSEALDVPSRLHIVVPHVSGGSEEVELEPLRTHPWRMRCDVMTLASSQPIDLATGGSAWVRGGGRLTVHPLRQDGIESRVRIDYDTDGYLNPGGNSLPVRGMHFRGVPYVVIADEQGREAFWIKADLENLESQEAPTPIFLGHRQEIRLALHEMYPRASERAVTPERRRRLALLPRCRVYVFWAVPRHHVVRDLAPVVK